ncbi:MAG: hypothetical protein ACI8XM_002901 [Haloarculaceae archaeon]|jgi:hypothetical protein
MDKIALILLLGMVALALYRRVRGMRRKVRARFQESDEDA